MMSAIKIFINLFAILFKTNLLDLPSPTFLKKYFFISSSYLLEVIEERYNNFRNTLGPTPEEEVLRLTDLPLS